MLQVFIDGNGDAEGNYTVVALLDDETVNGSLRMSMQTVGYFQYTPNASSNPHELPVSLFSGALFCVWNHSFILNLAAFAIL
jgi:guanylate cyclase